MTEKTKRQLDCLNIFKYEPSHLLTGPHLFFKYDKEEIHKYLQLLIPSTVNIMLFTNKIQIFPLRTTYSRTPYQKEGI